MTQGQGNQNLFNILSLFRYLELGPYTVESYNQVIFIDIEYIHLSTVCVYMCTYINSLYGCINVLVRSLLFENGLSDQNANVM